VLSLILILIVVGLALTGLLVLGALVLQGYFYTEVNPGVFWRGPVVGVILTLFLFFWCWINYVSPNVHKRDMPFDTLFNATGSVDLVNEPVKEMHVYFGNSKQAVKFERYKYVEGRLSRIGYREAGGDRHWSSKIKKIVITVNDREYVFERRHADDRSEYPYFLSPEGWFMREYDNGVNGQPAAFLVGLFLLDLLINFSYLALLVLGLWLVLRFQFWHALGLGAALWLAMIIFVVPYLLDLALPAA
jgi:hypothetical protein